MQKSIEMEIIMYTVINNKTVSYVSLKYEEISTIKVKSKKVVNKHVWKDYLHSHQLKFDG